MAHIITCGSLLAATLLLASCGGSDSSVSSTAATSSDATTSPSASESASESASPATPTAFTSKAYGYTLTLPPGWSSKQAKSKWDGKSPISHDASEVDQFPGTEGAAASAVAAATKQDLAAYTDAMIAANHRDHGDTCPAEPETQSQVTIGDDPGMLLEYDCGILINLAAAVHNGVGYQLLFRDPTVHAATDPDDHATFIGILESVQFPD